MPYTNSEMENWLRKRMMKTNEFLKLLGCSRPTLWKVKRGIPVCPKYANKIIEITKGEVVPLMEKVGRPW